MGNPEVFVDPESLRAVGHDVSVGLWHADGVLTREGDRLVPAGTAARWDSAPLLAETAAGWQGYLKDLQQRLEAFGDGLVASADQFEATDAYAAAGLAGIPAGHPAYGRVQGHGR